MVDAQQQVSLNQLGLNGRGADGDNRLLGENGGSFGNSPDIAGKREIRQIFQKFLAEQVPAPQVGDILGIKMEILNILDDLLQTRGNGVAAAIGALAEEYIKIADAVLIALRKVAVAHGQFIEVTEHRQVQFFVYYHRKHLVFSGYSYYTARP